MRVGFDRLCALVSSLAEQIFEGANTQRKVYQQELARIQETANMATRKAVSAHREQAALQMEQLKANLGTENSKLLDEISTKYQQVYTEAYYLCLYPSSLRAIDYEWVVNSAKKRIGSMNLRSIG